MPAPVLRPPRIPFSAPFFLLLYIFLSSGHAAESRPVTFHIRNKCPFSIWPAAAPNIDHPLIADGGFFLPAGTSKSVEAPPSWNGRLWARTGCEFASDSKPACQTGDCDGLLACNGTVGLPPATLVEVSLQADQDLPSFFDVSLVDGYNLPVSVSARPAEQGCFIGGCRRSPNEQCPREMQVVDESNGSVVACKSACLAYGLDEYCCRNAYGTPETCRDTSFSTAFKDACPSYLSYAFDSPLPLVTCYSEEYAITFCPSDWSSV